jgi:hypothetical protein
MWAGLSSGFPFLTRCFWNVLLVLLSLDESHLSGRSTSFVLRPFSIHPLFSFQRPCCFLAVRRLARHLLSYHFSCSTVKGQFLAFLAFLPLVKIKCSGSLEKIILIWVVILSTGEGSGEDSSLRSE